MVSPSAGKVSDATVPQSVVLVASPTWPRAPRVAESRVARWPPGRDDTRIHREDQSLQQICDDLLKSLPKLHAALRSNPSRNERVWRRTSSAGSSVNAFELVGMPPDDGGSDGSEVQYAVAASMTLKCHMNEVLNVLVSQTSSDYEATMEALNGNRFEGGELLYRERCRLLHNDGSKNASQALLGVQMAALRPSWRVRLTPSHLCHPEHPSTQRLCFSSLTHCYPGSDRAVHVMKTLPKRIHDQIIPRGFRSALRRDVDHLGVAFDIESRAADADKDVATQSVTTRIFVHAYVAAPTLENSFGYSPALDGRNGRPRRFASPDDWDKRGPSVVNPEAKHVVELLAHQLDEIERVIRRRRFGFQSFMYFQPSNAPEAGKSSFSQLRSMCQICLKRFTLFRREFYCQICGHLVCGECSQLYEVEARVGEVRNNRVCLTCVVRVDSCNFADEDIIAALGPTVVPLRRSSEWSQIFESDEFGSESIGDDILTASESSDASYVEGEEGDLAIQPYTNDHTECSDGLVQLGQILLDSSRTNRARCRSRGKSSARRKDSATKESVHTQLERYVNQSLRASQRQFPARSLKTAELVHDYRYTFDATRTTYEGHPLPPTPSPAREARRLHHIQASGILEPEYDHSALDLLAQVAAKRLNCPVGFISLVDETLFHSVGTYPPRNFGLQAPRTESMCSHTIYVDKPLVIKNAQADLRFAQLPVGAS
ncbi:Phosphatidylinositol-4-phosphate 5-kinase [Phytophthora cinnamomi]|uniref:Phosphatidylinositol-4-phosphate 5-kinase n=1 Tax=Phytophthora cinnamomi TaxID=4785 RepID=UPI00355A9A0C|nr:Phosphatidylinositol-4-phosphate 5-kinase [Phytophthora cinnamomi]